MFPQIFRIFTRFLAIILHNFMNFFQVFKISSSKFNFVYPSFHSCSTNPLIISLFTLDSISALIILTLRFFSYIMLILFPV